MKALHPDAPARRHSCDGCGEYAPCAGDQRQGFYCARCRQHMRKMVRPLSQNSREYLCMLRKRAEQVKR